MSIEIGSIVRLGENPSVYETAWGLIFVIENFKEEDTVIQVHGHILKSPGGWWGYMNEISHEFNPEYDTIMKADNIQLLSLLEEEDEYGDKD
jgi:hypothetical protein